MTFLVAGGDPAKPDLPTLVPALALLIAGIYTFASSRLWRVAAASAVAVAYILVTVLLNGRGLSRFDVAEFLVLALALAASGLKARTLAPAAGQ
jgi:hypothetical protein